MDTKGGWRKEGRTVQRGRGRGNQSRRNEEGNDGLGRDCVKQEEQPKTSHQQTSPVSSFIATFKGAEEEVLMYILC